MAKPLSTAGRLSPQTLLCAMEIAGEAVAGYGARIEIADLSPCVTHVLGGS